MTFAIYYILSALFCFVYFIHLTRKHFDVSLSDFVSILVISLIPLLREFVILSECGSKIVIKRYSK